MNRSFRAAESQMQASVQQQRQGRSLGAVMKDKEEDLALFLEMRKREKERNRLLLLCTSEDFDPPLGFLRHPGLDCNPQSSSNCTEVYGYSFVIQFGDGVNEQLVD